MRRNTRRQEATPGSQASPERHRTVARVALGPLATLVAATGASAQPRAWEAWDMHPMWGMWGLWGIGMMLGMLVFWGLVITGVVLGIRWLVRQGSAESKGDRALDILRERYARGEINREEFLARKRDL
jgi:putative membrane protein